MSYTRITGEALRHLLYLPDDTEEDDWKGEF